ncbi:MAG: hypothetical protein IKF39_00125 [Oscillospiraceae bacterium]|nr:hypothetical protein [Oscillospiraceae bacterium]
MPDQKTIINAFERCFCEQHDRCPGCYQRGPGFGIACRNALCMDVLDLLKAQEAVLVSAHWDDDTGHWIEGDRNGIDPHTRTTGEMIDTFRCSWCGFYQYWKTPFCPNCGAKMEDSRSGRLGGEENDKRAGV